jgi:hypothetical protein
VRTFPDKPISVLSVGIFISLVLFLTSMYYFKKVCTLFGARDSSLLLNSCCLGIASLTYCISLSINVASLATGYPEINELSENLKYTYIPAISLSAIWLVFAFQFDIYKWAIFILAS